MPQVQCARCQRDYLDQYDSCPWCGLRREKARASTGPVGPVATPSTTASAPITTPQASTTVSAPIAAPRTSTTVSTPTVAPLVTSGESLTLGRVLMSVAVIWGLIGLANVVEVFVGPPSSSAMRSFAFFFGVLFFLFPSLAFFAWGSSRNSRIKSSISAAWSAAAGVTGAAHVYGVEGVGEMPVWQLSWY